MQKLRHNDDKSLSLFRYFRRYQD